MRTTRLVRVKRRVVVRVPVRDKRVVKGKRRTVVVKRRRTVTRLVKVRRPVTETRYRTVPVPAERTCRVVPGAERRGSDPRAGSDLVLITEEDWLQPQCAGEGSFQTWRWDRGAGVMRHLDSWWTEKGNVGSDGRRETAATCSSHWFDQRGGFVTVGWYDQGTRVLDVRDPADIKQVGWAIGGTQVAAYWSPTDPSGQTLYSLDMVGGQVNVYRFARPMSEPAQTRAVALGDAAVARVDWERITGGAKTGFDGRFRRLCRVLLRSL